MKLQILPDEGTEDESSNSIDETPTQEGKVVPALKKPTKTPGPRSLPTTKKTKDTRRFGLVAQLWECMTEEGPSPCSPASESFEGDDEVDGDMIVVSTPSKGPKGRKIDVFAS